MEFVVGRVADPLTGDSTREFQTSSLHPGPKGADRSQPFGQPGIGRSPGL